MIILTIIFTDLLYLSIGIFIIIVAFFDLYLSEWFEKKANSEGVIFENKKIPFFAGLLSLLYTGLGQVYNGQIVKGLVIFSLAVIFYSLSLIISIIPLLILAIYSIYDAFSISKKMNTGQLPFQKEQAKYFFIFIILSMLFGMLIVLSVLTLFPESQF